MITPSRIRLPIIFFLMGVSSLLLAQNQIYFDPLRFESEISAFEAADQQAHPKPGGILFTGSSSIRFWHGRLAADMKGLTVIPRGFGGSTMQDAVYYIDRIVMPYQPRAIVLYAGDNDIGAYGKSAAQVRDLFQLFTALVHARLPQTRIYILAIKPSILRISSWPEMQAANSLLQAVCANDTRLRYIDLASPMLLPDGTPNPELFVDDKLHLNARGYDLWAPIVWAVLREQELQYE